MRIIKNLRNDLLKREEIVVGIVSDKNPGFDEVRKKISEKFSKPEENVNVYNIISNFGKKAFTIKANIYDSEKDLENMKKLKITRKKRKEIIKVEQENKQKSKQEVSESSEISE